ncbi:MAG: PAS domain S-box protein [Desulfobulbus sp.]|nr:PAS domain S-box protein [Desulfobulbus sp.]
MTPDGIAALVGHGHRVSVECGAGEEKLFGYSQKEVIGRSLHLIAPPEGKAAMANQVERLRRGAAMQSSGLTLIRRSGACFPAAVPSIPLPGMPAGSPERWGPLAISPNSCWSTRSCSR